MQRRGDAAQCRVGGSSTPFTKDLGRRSDELRNRRALRARRLREVARAASLNLAQASGRLQEPADVRRAPARELVDRPDRDRRLGDPFDLVGLV
jgi:hypothetical protein